MVSFASLVIINIVACCCRFSEKLVVLFLDQHQVLVVYLNPLLSFCSVYCNNYNPENNQLHNHLLDWRNFSNAIICSHITFNCLIKKFLSSIITFYSFISTFGKQYPVCTFLYCSFSNDRKKSIFSLKTWIN